ncbi:MAG: ABC transporter substrate-binding protein [Thermodesulfobacteriota bacterium]|jgi:branched-chain amino acid transport system substrate-binding protein
MKECTKNFAIVGVMVLFFGVAFLFPFNCFGIEEVKVGIIFPVTGPIAKTGITYFKACEYAVDKINSTGGIKSLGGAKIKLLKADSQASNEIGMSETERLIGEGVVAILGAYQSGVTYPCSQIAERNKVPWLVTGAIADELTERGLKYTFRAHPKTSYYAKDLYEFLEAMRKTRGLTIKTAGLLYENTLYGQSVAKNQKEFAPKYGFQIVVDIPYPHGTSDVSAEITKLKAAKPDVVFQSSYIGDAILITKKMKELNLNTMGIIASGAAHHQPEFIRDLGPLSEYFYVVCGWNSGLKIPGQKEIVEDFEKRYQEPMKEDGAIAISTMNILKDALERAASSDRQKVREALAKTKLSSGEKGVILPYNIEFGPNGENIHEKVIIDQILGGVRTTVFPPQIAVKNPVFPIPKWEQR